MQRRQLLTGSVLLLTLLAMMSALPITITAQGDKFEQKVDIGGYRLFIRCTGEGSPTVILEGPYSETSNVWRFVEPKVSQFTRVCVYERAGIGSSDQRPDHKTVIGVNKVNEELHTLLANANIPEPYVLAGWSYGGLVVNAYARHYPEQVVGAVFVDSSNIKQFSIQTIPPDRSSLGTQQIVADFQTLPPFPPIPLIVLQQSPRYLDQNDPILKVWPTYQAEFAKLSPQGQLIVAANSDHAIPEREPALVINALARVVAIVRGGSAAPSPTPFWTPQPTNTAGPSPTTIPTKAFSFPPSPTFKPTATK